MGLLGRSGLCTCARKPYQEVGRLLRLHLSLGVHA